MDYFDFFHPPFSSLATIVANGLSVNQILLRRSPPCCTNAWRPSERKFRQSGRNVPHHPVHPFLGLWEHFHNPDFNYIEFEAIETEAGLNSFVLTPKRWVEQTPGFEPWFFFFLLPNYFPLLEEVLLEKEEE